MKQQQQLQLPDGWEAVVSKSSGETYFRQISTGETAWEFPAERAPVLASEPALEPEPEPEPEREPELAAPTAGSPSGGTMSTPAAADATLSASTPPVLRSPEQEQEVWREELVRTLCNRQDLGFPSESRVQAAIRKAAKDPSVGKKRYIL